MRELVKEFIEDNIGLVESESWEVLFHLWYDDYYDYTDRYKDDQALQEIFKMFEGCGINLREESLPARMKIMTDVMKNYILITFRFGKGSSNEFVPFSGCVNHLNSRLSLTLSQLRECFEAAAKSLPQPYVLRGLTVYKE